ncbi:MAG: hypothetical protein AAF844_02390 [Pseudomonadota bacterium]
MRLFYISLFTIFATTACFYMFYIALAQEIERADKIEDYCASILTEQLAQEIITARENSNFSKVRDTLIVNLLDQECSVSTIIVFLNRAQYSAIGQYEFSDLIGGGSNLKYVGACIEQKIIIGRRSRICIEKIRFVLQDEKIVSVSISSRK